MKTIKGTQRMYQIIAILSFAIGGGLLIVSVLSGAFPLGLNFILLQLVAGYTVMVIGIIYPHLEANDERAQKIRERGLFIGYFFIMGYILIFYLIDLMNLLALEVIQVLQLLMALVIVTVFSIFWVLTKRY